MKFVISAVHCEVRILPQKNRQFLQCLEQDWGTYRMITRYIIAGNDTEDLRRITQWSLIARVEECGVAGVKARGYCSHIKVGGDSTSFDREFSRSAVTI